MRASKHAQYQATLFQASKIMSCPSDGAIEVSLQAIQADWEATMKSTHDVTFNTRHAPPSEGAAAFHYIYYDCLHMSRYDEVRNTNIILSCQILCRRYQSTTLR
ncbi:hypothetical protein PV11_05542 [Exophiala sideris]|uniref:Uncharacterized protein n=1 Tax=Exophiala sideris TaxID=1016849 RepID=A0A0D1YL46_9EURO|nr:hypothetical protein PV11_05542 [Exophiala sideris]